MTQSDKPIAIVGAGSWGTALAIQFARTGRPTFLWGHDPKHLATLSSDRVNKKYLPDAPFPEALQIESSLSRALGDATDVLIVVPSHAFREMLKRVKPLLLPDARLCWATKGFELETGKLPHEVVADVLGDAVPKAVLSGPTFANEVGLDLPTAMTVASADESFAADIAASISSENFRAYTTTDVIGVEVGAAVKNVLAIGAGISDGLGFGANTRVALITRGLHEMTRLGLALGAQAETFMGLAGMGDLVLTCTDDQSRNRRMGLALAQGKGVEAAQHEIGQVVEGVHAARAVREVAQAAGVDMPISEQIYRVLYEDTDPRTAVSALMGRNLKRES
ncbi:MAG: NAD(P)H-dependent glycerol-3-phosphate dehydrogenase [Gammaproteobacteria bacterium]|nr:NAD(P)H-dependent glycerol-3-phosphate dehydrogenase [Gammaproteobacteria bacterium]MDH3766966.1 NAD(P)H-dependent glycerol-3-phosphate dehydrogenase [Gammaproteobacteria bacterium]